MGHAFEAKSFSYVVSYAVKEQVVQIQEGLYCMLFENNLFFAISNCGFLTCIPCIFYFFVCHILNPVEL